MSVLILSPSAKDCERFMRYVVRVDNGCLLWTGGLSGDGYGNFWFDSKSISAHRFSFLVNGGILSEERPWVLHNCPGGDNPLCCEPSHLWAGSHSENQADRLRKGGRDRPDGSLPIGVFKERGRYRVRLRRRFGSLGMFGSLDDAIRARDAAVLAATAGLPPIAGE